MGDKVATYSAPEIGAVFESVVDQVAKAYATAGQSRVAIQAVDVELNFKSVNIAENGWALFGKDTKESKMEIRLATRIVPDVAPEKPTP